MPPQVMLAKLWVDVLIVFIIFSESLTVNHPVNILQNGSVAPYYSGVLSYLFIIESLIAVCCNCTGAKGTTKKPFRDTMSDSLDRHLFGIFGEM